MKVFFFLKKRCQIIPGNFFGFLNGTNFAPIASAMGGPKIKPRASIPTQEKLFIRTKDYGQ